MKKMRVLLMLLLVSAPLLAYEVCDDDVYELSPLEQKFLRACSGGRVRKVQGIVRHGINSSVSNHSEETGLHLRNLLCSNFITISNFN